MGAEEVVQEARQRQRHNGAEAHPEQKILEHGEGALVRAAQIRSVGTRKSHAEHDAQRERRERDDVRPVSAELIGSVRGQRRHQSEASHHGCSTEHEIADQEAPRPRRPFPRVAAREGDGIGSPNGARIRRGIALPLLHCRHPPRDLYYLPDGR